MANEEGVKIVITAEDRFTENIKKIEASTKIFGETAKNTERYLAALEKEMVRLVANGMDPANKKIVEMKQNYDKLSSSINSTEGSLKKSNQQWTSLALVVQDLPYGFRGIQNNLPALIGGVAGMAGPLYLLGSAVIAFFTAWDAGIIKFSQGSENAKKYTKDLTSEFVNETTVLASLYRVATNVNASSKDRLLAVQSLKKEYPGLLGNYSDEDIMLGKAKESYNKLTQELWRYAKAKAAENAITELARKSLELDLKVAEEEANLPRRYMQNSNRVTSAYLLAQGRISNLKKEQASLNKEVEKYQAILDKNITAGQQKTNFADDSAMKAAAAAAKKAIKEHLDAVKSANEAETNAYIKTLDERAQKEYKAGLELASNLEKMKAAGYTDSTTYYTAYRAEMDNIGKYYDDKQIEEAKKASEKIASIQMDMRFQMQSALASINEQFAKEDVKTVNTQLEATLKATRGNYQAQKAAIEAAIIKNQEFRQSAIDAGYGTKVFDDSLVNLKAKLEGLVDPVETLEINFNTAINSIATGALVELGTQIGNVFSGAGFSMNGFLGLIADALIKLGTYLVTISELFVAIKALFASGGALAPWAIPIGLAAIAAGVALKATLGKESTPAFANGGIVSGPTLGLMGEYPGARNNPEVIAPLDKLQSMMGGGVGGSLSARISGNDLLLLMNKTKRSNSTIF